MYILVVEDEELTSAMVHLALSKEGYQVEIADNPRAAMHLIQKQEPDLLILDINMPYQNGFEFSKKLRSEGYETPIIFMTSRDAVEDRLQGFNLGADDYICKPFNFLELVARAQAVIRRTKKATHNGNQTLRSGQFELFPADLRLVTSGGKDIRLTPIETRILRILMESAGQVVKRGHISAEIWHDEECSSNSVDVYIRRLRLKLEDDAQHSQHIISVRGSGYKFIG